MLRSKKEINQRTIINEDQDETLANFDTEMLGANIYKLAFVCALGDPSRMERNKNKDTDSGKATPKIVGAKFKCLEAVQVPQSPPLSDFKKNLMAYDPDNIQWVWVQPGDTVLLTPFECSLLFCQPTFNGVCMGGDRPVSVVCTTSKKEKTALDTTKKLPRVALRALNPGDSVKDLTIENVLRFEEVTDPKTGRRTKVKEIIPGYEKWQTMIGGGRGRGAKQKLAGDMDPTKTPNVNAQKYYDLLGKTLPKEVLAPKDESYEEVLARARQISS